MKAAKVAIGLIALAMLLSMVPSNASADSRTIAAGDSFEKEITVDANEIVPYFWSSTGDLHFTLRGPGGAIVDESTGMADGNSLVPTTGGKYTFEWENTGSSSVVLTYTVNWFQNVEEGFSFIVWAAIITAVIVVVIIIVVVLVVVLGGKKKTAAPMAGMTGPVPMAPVGGNCPMCGTPIPAEGMYCAKCGAKIR